MTKVIENPWSTRSLTLLLMTTLD